MTNLNEGCDAKGRPESQVASELNNLLQIISGTSALIENVWEGAAGSDKYFAMLRASIERAEEVTAQLVAHAGGKSGKAILHPALRQSSLPTKTRSPETQQFSLLVADDEGMTLSLLQNLFSQADYQVTTAQSGSECLDLFGRQPQPFDLVLLDLAMPGMDGEETFRRLRQIMPSIDVVLMAGFVESDRLDRMMSSGLTGFLGKPFTDRDVLPMVESILKRSGADRSLPTK